MKSSIQSERKNKIIPNEINAFSLYGFNIRWPLTEMLCVGIMWMCFCLIYLFLFLFCFGSPFFKSILYRNWQFFPIETHTRYTLICFQIKVLQRNTTFEYQMRKNLHENIVSTLYFLRVQKIKINHNSFFFCFVWQENAIQFCMDFLWWCYRKVSSWLSPFSGEIEKKVDRSLRVLVTHVTIPFAKNIKHISNLFFGCPKLLIASRGSTRNKTKNIEICNVCQSTENVNAKYNAQK